MKDKALNTTILWIVIITLFFVILVLILAMFSGLIEYKFSDPFINALGTFSGALAGATLAGIFSLKVFNKNMKYEEQKKENEQSIKKAIYLDAYLRVSRETMEELRILNYRFIETHNKQGLKEPEIYKAAYEFQIYTPVLILYNNSRDEITKIIDLLKKELADLSYEAIHDYEFIRTIKYHQDLLKIISKDFSKISSLTTIEQYKDLWLIQECVANIQKYLGYYNDLEDELRKMKY